MELLFIPVGAWGCSSPWALPLLTGEDEGALSLLFRRLEVCIYAWPRTSGVESVCISELFSALTKYIAKWLQFVTFGGNIAMLKGVLQSTQSSQMLTLKNAHWPPRIANFNDWFYVCNCTLTLEARCWRIFTWVKCHCGCGDKQFQKKHLVSPFGNFSEPKPLLPGATWTQKKFGNYTQKLYTIHKKDLVTKVSLNLCCQVPFEHKKEGCAAALSTCQYLHCIRLSTSQCPRHLRTSLTCILIACMV